MRRAHLRFPGRTKEGSGYIGVRAVGDLVSCRVMGTIEDEGQSGRRGRDAFWIAKAGNKEDVAMTATEAREIPTTT